MLPRRLPLILAFVGGCLSTAALVGVWRVDDETSAPASRAPVVDPVAPDIAPTSAVRDEAIAPQREPAVAQPVESESGRSVADVLARLEAQYREELAAAERVTPPAVTTAAEAAAPPVEVPAPPETPVAAAEPAPAPAAPVLANVQVANVQQDVYNGDVHQGDVNQAQQIALIQYVQLLTLPPNGRVTTPNGAKPRRMPPAHIAITDPNNPWGFDFPPTPLVK